MLIEFSFGLIFWMTVSFLTVLFILRKFAWKPILSTLSERERTIEDALNEAKKAREEIAAMNSRNAELDRAAREERELLLKEARDIREKEITEAKEKAKVEVMKVGHGLAEGTVIGPLIDSRAVDKADEHVQDAIAKGATLVTGGQRLTEGEFAKGAFYAPTILDGVTREMDIFYEETFGPVAGLTVFDTEDEVIELANDSIYGLASYFHTKDYARLMRVAERLEYGIVGANAGIISAANAPFGGVKQSGYGPEGGSVGIDEYLEVKYVLMGGVGTV